MTITHTIRRVAALAAGALVLGLSPLTAAASASATADVGQAVRVAAFMPSSHTAGDTPVYHLSRTPHAVMPMLHTCAQARSAADTVRQGVLCADISDNGNGTFTAKVEGLCETQSGGVVVQCSNITEHMQVWNTIAQDDDLTFICGHTPNPACPAAPNNRFINGRVYIVPSGVCHEVWTVVVAASSPITLPKSGRTVFISANLGSGHIIVCG